MFFVSSTEKLKEKYIIKFQKGNVHAYKQLFGELYPVMCSFANKFLKNTGEAEDNVQEAFIELWKQHEKFISLDQIKAFLYLSVKNRCLNVLKHHKIKGRYAQNILNNEEAYFHDHLIEAEFVSLIKEAIQQLTDQRKEIILLMLQGLKNNEIAERLNISVNTVKMQKKIAYRQLREKLQHSLLLLLDLF